jgi:glyceraldehyde-3-phosphate dehydrogenase (NADP+)
MLIAGTWRGAADGRMEEVRSPFDGHVIDTVPVASIQDAQDALDRAEIGAHLQRSTPAHVRVDILLRAAALADERAEDIAQTISAETGKPITEARG